MSAEGPVKLVAFRIEEHTFALRVSAVERVLRAVYVDPLPNAPPIVLGLINVQGRIVPVVDARQRLGLRPRDVQLTDHFVITHTSYRSVALVVDEVSEVLEVDAESIVSSRQTICAVKHIEGTVLVSSGLILINDLSQFLSIEEELTVRNALHDVTQL